MSGSGISWAVCKSASRSRQITTPAPHHSVFYRPDALPAAQPTASKHWRHQANSIRSAEIKNQLKGALRPAARMRYDPQRVCLARLEEKQKFTKRIRRLFQREHRWRVRPETWDPDTSRSHRSKWTWWRLYQLACAAAKTDLHHTTKQHPQGGSVAEWLACLTRAQKARVQIAAKTLSGNSLRKTVHTHCASVHQAAPKPYAR